MDFKRIQRLKLANSESCFLWGPRQVGKTTFLKSHFSSSKYYDLLDAKTFQAFSTNPSLMAEEILATPALQKYPIIIDEVQKNPLLLDEVQRLIVNHKLRFILCGSSARKLKRGGGNLLGGRAIRYELFPLVYKEIPQFNLLHALNYGFIPRHYLSHHPLDLLGSYVGEYLKEEILAEALTRNIFAFSQFLEKAAFSNGEMVVLKNIASDCGVDAKTIRAYFEILEDTLLARFVPSFQKRPKRKVIKAPRFYFFDVGLVNFLLKRKDIQIGSELFGKAFEHFIYQEIIAHQHYSRLGYHLFYWHTTSGYEVDFILGDAHTLVEVKGVSQVRSHHLKGIKAFGEEYKSHQRFVVSLDSAPRLVDDILILPWKDFLEKLWGGEIIK